VPIRRIDRRLGELDDRSLIIALYQLGWAGLVTNNYKMLYVPAQIAAIVKTKLLVFAVEGVGHDPLRATGTLLLDLPGALKRYRPRASQVYRVKPRDPRPVESWTYLVEAARRIKVEPDPLYSQVRVSDDELQIMACTASAMGRRQDDASDGVAATFAASFRLHLPRIARSGRDEDVRDQPPRAMKGPARGRGP